MTKYEYLKGFHLFIKKTLFRPKNKLQISVLDCSDVIELYRINELFNTFMDENPR